MRIIIPALCLLALFVASCQKEPGVELNPPGNDVNDSIYISQYVELDTTYPTGSDTAFKYVFTYDGQKRVTTITEYNFNTGTQTYYTVMTDTYFYKDTDTVPYKVAEVNVDGSNNTVIRTDTAFLQYDNGLIKKDSTRLHDGSGLLRVQVLNYTKMTSNKYKITGVDNVDSIMVDHTVSNGNIASETLSLYSGGMLNNSFSFNNTCDNKPNPFYRISLHYPVIANYSHVGYFTSESKNNITESIVTNPLSEHFVMAYTYRNDGYPLIVRFLTPGGPADGFKGAFVYTKL